jgi:uncharacterized protein (TIGR02145 family)
MIKLFTILVAILLMATVWAQSPQKMSYQAVIRNSSNAIVASGTVGMRISILQGSATGTAVYTETQTATTNANGLVSIEIGGGTGFDAINWASGVYFIKTETDPTGGTNYTITGTSQLLSVPYALYAKTSGSSTLGPKGDKGDAGTQGIQGERGEKGEKGDTGLTGATGVKGADGLTTSVNGVTQVGGAITLTKANLGLGNVDNTSDANKPVSTSTQTTLDTKVDKVIGKGLSTEDYTSAEQSKLAGIATGAEVNVQADWNQTTNTADDYIKNKPTIPAAQVQTDWTASSGMGVLLNKPANIDEDKTDDVTLTGNQTIAGNKTLSGTTVFTGTTTVPTPVNATDAATKAYVDALLQKINQLESQPGVLKDVDGNLYTTIKIDAQVWMTENLKTTKYADGTTIPLVNTTSTWDALTATSKAYCWYNDDIANKATYGALYTWAAAMNGAASVTTNPSGVQGVCPTGWHLPSDAEWTQLTTYLGDTDVAGGKLKETGTTHWTSPNTGATNETGFTALPGGYRDGSGSFNFIGSLGYWWCATEDDVEFARFRCMYGGSSTVGRGGYRKEVGTSVRCVRD